MPRDNADHRLVVRGTEILPGDPRQRYREKIARITLDSMVQFVGLLDASGTVLEMRWPAPSWSSEITGWRLTCQDMVCAWTVTPPACARSSRIF